MSLIGKENGRKIKIVDTTLRDGEQTAGVVFANREKIMIAEMLSDLGIDQLEVGIPTMGGDELKAIKDICNRNLKSSIMAWNRAVISDIEKSIECGVDSVAISISVSDIHIENKLRTSRAWVLENMAKSVEFAKKNGLYVSVNGEDASRADLDFLTEFIEVGKQAGADRFRYCDTVGIMNPQEVARSIKTLYDRTNFDIEMHTHNDFGMATANALAGVDAGANYVGVTVNGLGERAGNAALEEVIMGLKYLYGYSADNIDTTKFKGICEYVSQASNRQLPIWKPVVGENMFIHESGIHADGALKDPHNYEAFDPKEVALERKIVIGKHSGRASIVNKLNEYDIHVSPELAGKILEAVRATSIRLKRSLMDKEIIHLYCDVIAKEETISTEVVGG
ncbi:homocitrate synthase [Metaclostridioides mangenotii]|uniref:homocitrate synthase n=1 Tax=Metaclostridioides mangenotii TaxID=1540 RepID=UPI0028E7DFD7|nr:homocitrate synthase [Clostridioides mangenotii]